MGGLRRPRGRRPKSACRLRDSDNDVTALRAQSLRSRGRFPARRLTERGFSSGHNETAASAVARAGKGETAEHRPESPSVARRAPARPRSLPGLCGPPSNAVRVSSYRRPALHCTLAGPLPHPHGLWQGRRPSRRRPSVVARPPPSAAVRRSICARHMTLPLHNLGHSPWGSPGGLGRSGARRRTDERPRGPPAAPAGRARFQACAAAPTDGRAARTGDEPPQRHRDERRRTVRPSRRGPGTPRSAPPDKCLGCPAPPAARRSARQPWPRYARQCARRPPAPGS